MNVGNSLSTIKVSDSYAIAAAYDEIEGWGEKWQAKKDTICMVSRECMKVVTAVKRLKQRTFRLL